MKVLFYNGSLRMGGGEKILVEILKGIKKEGKEIELLISDENEDENFFENEIPKEVKLSYLISKERIKQTIFFKEKKNNLIYKFLYNYSMKKEQKEKKSNLEIYLKDRKYDVVVDFDMGLSKNIDMVNSDLKIAWIHSPIDKWYKKKDRIKRLGERLKKYDMLVTICDELKDATKLLYPFLEERVVRIYNPFDIEDILEKSRDESEVTNTELNLLKDDYFISVGRLDDYSKDYYTLLRGYKESLESGIKEKLYILGDGPEKSKIEGWVGELGLKERVILLGKKRNPYIWIKNAKLFIHSSRFEGLPTVLIEALICETPVISSDCKTGPREILDNGRYGRLYDVGDFIELGRLIQELMVSEEMYGELVFSSLERSKMFSKKTVLGEVENILKEKKFVQEK